MLPMLGWVIEEREQLLLVFHQRGNRLRILYVEAVSKLLTCLLGLLSILGIHDLVKCPLRSTPSCAKTRPF